MAVPSLVGLVSAMSRAGTLSLPPLPEAALRIEELLRRDEGDPREVGDLIQHEPAIAASVIRMANSAAFGGLREVERVDEAVARLGMRQVGVIVVAVAHKGQFTSDDPERGVLLRALWEHAVATATAARHLCGPDGAEGAEAFLAGLLHDVGKLLVVKAVDVLGKRGVTACTPPVVDELMERLHPTLGHDTLTSWKLPGPICDVALHHHDGAPEGNDRLLARVQAANALTRRMGLHPNPEPDLDLAAVPAVERLGLTELELAALMVDVEDEFARVKTLL
jgi:HD-like signal output (HDOD) protein